MIGTEQTYQILIPTTEICGSVKYSMGITNLFRTDTENRTDPNIQPTIVYLNQATLMVHSYWNHFSLGSLDSVTDVPRSGRNIDNRTWINPQGPIVNTIPDSNRSNS